MADKKHSRKGKPNLIKEKLSPVRCLPSNGVSEVVQLF